MIDIASLGSALSDRDTTAHSVDLLGGDGGDSNLIPSVRPSVHLSSCLSIHRSSVAICLVYLLPVSLVLATTGCCM
jgi:hypothetical protein